MLNIDAVFNSKFNFSESIRDCQLPDLMGTIEFIEKITACCEGIFSMYNLKVTSVENGKNSEISGYDTNKLNRCWDLIVSIDKLMVPEAVNLQSDENIFKMLNNFFEKIFLDPKEKLLFGLSQNLLHLKMNI